jgi:hypothetical protein
MNLSGPDVHQILEYRTANAIVRLLPTGLLMIFLALFIFVLADPGREPVATHLGIPLVLVAGSAVIGVALWTRANPGKPLFTLSPAGIHYRIPWVKELLIPWREIQGVDSINIVTQQSSLAWLFVDNVQPPYRNTLFFIDVTVVLVSKQFYDSQIFVRSYFLRGPGWKANFIPKGDLVQTALHHALVSVEPKALRQAVEVRWHAFRDQAAAAPTRTSVPAAGYSGAQITAASGAASTSNVVAMGDNPRTISRWEATKIIVLLIGIATLLFNIVGLWQLPGQSEGREASAQARAKARAERTYWEDLHRRTLEEDKKRDAEEKERQRDFDETMRKAFGR